MALNLSGAPFKLTPEDMGAPDYAGSLLGGLQGGTEAYFQAPMHAANLNKLRSEAVKNNAWGNLLKMAMGQGGAEQSGMGLSNGQPSEQNNQLFPHLNPSANALTAAILHASPYITSPQQAQDIKTNAELKTKQAETSIGEAKKIREEAEDLSKTYGYVRELQRLMKENPNLTNPVTGFAAKFGIGNEAGGRFNALSLKLQAELARQISQRGGKGAAELAALGKTNLSNLPAYNNGVLASLEKDLRLNLSRYAQRHKQLTGKELPYNFDQTNTATSGVPASENLSAGVDQDGNQVIGSFEKPPQKVGRGKIRVYFPDGAHDIPEGLYNQALEAGATSEPQRR